MGTLAQHREWMTLCAAGLALAVTPVKAAAEAEPSNLGRVGGPEPKALEPETLPGAFGQRFSIQEENDVFGFASKTDRYYTQGLRVSARWSPARQVFDKDWAAELWGFEIGQNIYTPTSITETDLAKLRLDRPYAGYLYAGLTLDLRGERLNIIPGWLRGARGLGEVGAFTGTLHFSLRYGQTGPAAAGGAVQTGFRSTCYGPLPGTTSRTSRRGGGSTRSATSGAGTPRSSTPRSGCVSPGAGSEKSDRSLSGNSGRSPRGTDLSGNTAARGAKKRPGRGKGCTT